MPVADDDWRLEILAHHEDLKGVLWVWKPFRAYREGWDHDHCCACSAKFMEPGVRGEDLLHEGFTTTDAYVRGAEYEWLCAPCFHDLAHAMDWRSVRDDLPRPN